MSVAQIGCTEDLNRMARIVEVGFREMPGLRLTRAQAQRLWNMSREDCADVLDHLMSAGRLVQDPVGQYCAPRTSY